MSTWDRIIEKYKQIPHEEQMDYVKRQQEKFLADENFKQAFHDAKNMEIVKSQNGLMPLVDLANAGNIRAMYDVAAVFYLYYTIFKENGETDEAIDNLVRSNLWVEEAQKLSPNQSDEVKLRLANIRERIAKYQHCISVGNYTVGLKTDGTVVYFGEKKDLTKDWCYIVAIAAGKGIVGEYIVGLKANGTVDVVGDKYYRSKTKDWRDIIAIAAGDNHVVGLKADGTVISDGLGVKHVDSKEGSVESIPCKQCNTKDWRNIVAIAAGNYHTVGLKKDGTVVAVGDNNFGQCNTLNWSNVVAVFADESFTVGLKADGTVVAVGESIGQRNTTLRNAYINCNLPFKNSDFTVDNTHNWKDIVVVADGGNHRVGLKADGTVVACGLNSDGQCNTTDWRDIVAVFTGRSNTYGLKADGSIVATGENNDQSNVIISWENIGYPSEEQVEKMKQSLRWQAEGKCPKCGGDTTGLGKCKSCGKGGCYVATCVYGSYDCPEVWTLRRFRDNSLSSSWFGKQFVQMYYTVSPKIVGIFGNKKWFNLICKSVLDKLVKKLQNNGVDNSPYSD